MKWHGMRRLSREGQTLLGGGKSFRGKEGMAWGQRCEEEIEEHWVTSLEGNKRLCGERECQRECPVLNSASKGLVLLMKIIGSQWRVYTQWHDITTTLLEEIFSSKNVFKASATVIMNHWSLAFPCRLPIAAAEKEAQHCFLPTPAGLPSVRGCCFLEVCWEAPVEVIL